jgi:hypothetical protein
MDGINTFNDYYYLGLKNLEILKGLKGPLNLDSSLGFHGPRLNLENLGQLLS